MGKYRDTHWRRMETLPNGVVVTSFWVTVSKAPSRLVEFLDDDLPVQRMTDILERL